MTEMFDDRSEQNIIQVEIEKIASRQTAYYDILREKAERVRNNNKKDGDYLVDSCRNILIESEPNISPFVDTLLYHYDYVDGWVVKIICENGFYIDDFYDNSNNAECVLVADNTDKDRDFYSFLDNQKGLFDKPAKESQVIF